MARAENGKREEPAKRTLEAIASSIGALLALATLGVIVWDGIREEGRPAFVTLRSEAVHQYDAGYVVEIVALNSGDQTAAELLVEGTLRQAGQVVEASEVVFDFVPSRSERRGALVFAQDPRSFELLLQAKGYIEP
jgi:uncharacterized protein (TIGR02588 family)